MKKIFRISFVLLLCLTMLMGTACRQNPSTDGSSMLSGDYYDDDYNYDDDYDDDNDSSDDDQSDNSSDDADDKKNNSNKNNSNKNNSNKNNSNKNNSNKNNNNKNENNNNNNTTNDDEYVPNLNGRTLTVVNYFEELKKGSSQQANYYWKHKEAIEKKYNCKIEHVFKSRADIDEEIIPSILAGQPAADFFYVFGDRAYAMVRKNLLYPISDVKTIDLEDDVWNDLIHDVMTHDGKLYGLCPVEEPGVKIGLLYNKDYFKKNNIPDLNTLQRQGKLDWNKLREVFKQANTGEVSGFVGNMGYEFDVPTLIVANGGTLVSRNADYTFKNNSQSKNVINAMNFYNNLVMVDKVCPGKTNHQDAGAFAGEMDFCDGNIAVLLSESYRWPDVVRNSNFEVGLALVPAGPDAPSNYKFVTQNGGGTLQSVVMPANVENPQDVAFVMAKFLSGGSVPWEEFYYDLFYDDDIMTVLEMGMKQFRDGIYITDYLLAVGDTYEMGLHGPFGKWSRGELTAAQTVESLGSVIESAVDDYNKNF